MERSVTASKDELDARVAEELKKHSDTDFAWDKWYCECGFRLRRGYTELAAHQKDIERKLREETTRG
jgi:hypothetical protein